MAWIKVIDEHEAEGELKEAYDFIMRQRGKFGNVLRLHSLNP